jgi:hypothetical protein
MKTKRFMHDFFWKMTFYKTLQKDISELGCWEFEGRKEASRCSQVKQQRNNEQVLKRAGIFVWS